MFAIFVGITLVVTYWASGQSTTQPRLLRRPPAHRRLAERLGDRRRLHVGRVVPRNHRSGRVLRLRRIHVLGRLAGRLSRRALSRRRAAAQHRQVHDGRPDLVPPARPRRPRDRGALDAGDHALLHDRADGRRRRARQFAAAAGSEDRRDRRRRRADARLRSLRRHARDDVGADHQGGPLARDGDRALAAGRRHFHFSLGELLQRRDGRCPSAASDEPAAAGTALSRAAGRVESHLARVWRWCWARRACRTS